MNQTTASAAKTGNILSKISAVRLKVRLVGLIKVVAATILMLGGGVVLSFIIDHEWEPDIPSRIPLMAFIAGVVLVGVLSSIWLWLRKDLSDDQVALMIEQANPWLEDSLISAVQLSREQNAGDQYHSDEMINSMINRAGTNTASFESVHRGRLTPVLPLVLAAGVIVAALAGSFQYEGTQVYAKTWADRVLLMKKESYPKPVYIKVVIPKEHQSPANETLVHVVRGEDLEISVDITQGGTEEMKVLTTFEISGQKEVKKMRRLSDMTFIKTFENVTEPFSFKVDAGYGVISEVYTVKLIDRARIEQAHFWLEYPEYTKREPTPEKDPIRAKNSLDVPVGTVLRYKIFSSMPIENAALQFFFDKANKEMEEGPTPSIATDGEKAGLEFTGKFQVKRSMRFRYILKSTGGLVSDQNSKLYSLRTIEDRPPIVKFKEPGRSQSVTKKAVIPMLLSVKDEYGVDRVLLRTTISRSGTVLKKDQRALENPEGTEKQAIYKWDFRIEDMELQEGDQLEYYVVAYDRNFDESKRAGQSLAYTFTIVSGEDLSRMLQDRMMQLKGDLESVAKTQDKARREMQKTAEDLALKQKLDRDDQRRLGRLENAQNNVSKRMKQITESFDKLLKERQVNQIRDEREDILQKNLKKASKEIADLQSPAVARDIAEVKSKAEKIDQTKLALLPDKQEKVEDSIRKLIDKLDKWGDISDADREINEIIEMEKRIREATGSKLKDKHK